MHIHIMFDAYAHMHTHISDRDRYRYPYWKSVICIRLFLLLGYPVGSYTAVMLFCTILSAVALNSD